jgi:hypothetical protein
MVETSGVWGMRVQRLRRQKLRSYHKPTGYAVDAAAAMGSFDCLRLRRRAERRLFMADHTKFNIRLLEIVMPLTALSDLVVDKPLPKNLAEATEAAEVTTVVA